MKIVFDFIEATLPTDPIEREKQVQATILYVSQKYPILECLQLADTVSVNDANEVEVCKVYKDET
ncbi:hypothetical protein [Nodosilinea nodulosa]|uniref:hypothetical protein n=1 Tax=Nodosilinea nodulosa TaxID=416001 RepID=UPI0002DE368B|nr:hypothetical protein [Nodosilinea nodulosa]